MMGLMNELSYGGLGGESIRALIENELTSFSIRKNQMKWISESGNAMACSLYRPWGNCFICIYILILLYGLLQKVNQLFVARVDEQDDILNVCVMIFLIRLKINTKNKQYLSLDFKL